VGGYARVGGLDMYYEVHGDGPPLVLLHGGLHSIELTFGKVLPALAASRRVIAAELQGHGRTADTDRPLTWPALAADVVGLLDLLGVERADVFGFSLGGLVATQLAISHPGRVRRLVLASSEIRPDGSYDDVRDPALFAASTRMPTEADFARMRAEYLRLAPDPDHFAAFQQKLGTAVGTFPGWPAEEVAAITAPALVLVGDNDFVRVDHADEIRRLIPGSQLAVLPGTTHVQVPDRPELLVPLVTRFLAQDR
jgi:pimeloyl-ACP methyl ester carboxylesterase